MNDSQRKKLAEEEKWICVAEAKTACIYNKTETQVFVRPKEVKSIKLLTDLDKGSHNNGISFGDWNDGASDTTKEGFAFGKKYEFIVTAFKNDRAVKYENLIKWQYSYLTDSKDPKSIKTVELPKTGKKVTVVFKDRELCGKTVTVRAYIHDVNNDAIYENFHHYYFRYFDRAIVEQQLDDRMARPWRVNQGATSLCGVACIFYIFAKNFKSEYKQFVMDVHEKGLAKYNNYELKPNESFAEMNPTNNPKAKYPDIPYADWLSLASTRNKEGITGAYKGKAGQDAMAINWPGIMISCAKNLLGYTDVKMDYHARYKHHFSNNVLHTTTPLKILKENINRDHLNQYEICMMIDADMLKNNPKGSFSDFGEYHWIVYEGKLFIKPPINSEADYKNIESVAMNIFTWGENPIKKSRLSGNGIAKNAFRNNYYAYLRMK